MIERDPELARLLALELERHLAAFERDPPDIEAAHRAIHALKGSVGLAGERDLAVALSHIERRLDANDATALTDAAGIVRAARDRIASGKRATESTWPEPPSWMTPSSIDPSMRLAYAGEIRDRLAAIDAALESPIDRDEAAREIFRHVHTIKGAASSVGDELVAWFCHGLEERLRARSPLEEAARWRAVLGGLLDDPEATLRALRGGRRSVAPRRDTEEPRSNLGEDVTIRVAAVAIDRVLERVATMSEAQELDAGSEEIRARASTLRRFRSDLRQALRAIGPPRPWGAPAAALHQIENVTEQLARMSEDLDASAATRRAWEQSLRDSLVAAKRELIGMRQARLGGLFARLATAIEAEARRAGKRVAVSATGSEELVDRRVAEALLEPCLQLARNAVAHGIEPPPVREAMGKSPTASISIAAHRHGSRLRVTIEDDGAGVDVAALRVRAIESGAVSREVAEALDDNTLLGLLFLPGFSTRDNPDFLAGRGVGLDITLAAVQRMAGALRVSSRRGEGFRATLEVPIESGVARILWVRAGADHYALFASYVRRVELAQEGIDVPHLSVCLERGASAARPRYVLELDVDGDEATHIGVDDVGRTEDHVIRPLTPLLASMGPFVGAVIRALPSEGKRSVPILALDAFALASRVRALRPK